MTSNAQVPRVPDPKPEAIVIEVGNCCVKPRNFVMFLAVIGIGILGASIQVTTLDIVKKLDHLADHTIVQLEDDHPLYVQWTTVGNHSERFTRAHFDQAYHSTIKLCDMTNIDDPHTKRICSSVKDVHSSRRLQDGCWSAGTSTAPLCIGNKCCGFCYTNLFQSICDAYDD